MVWYAGTLPGRPSPTTLIPQLGFTWYELTYFSSYGLAALQSATTLDEAVVAFQNDFEGCGDCQTGNREAYAQEVFNEYGSSPPVTPPTAVSMTPDNVGTGYWVLSNTGAIYSFDTAAYRGGASGQVVSEVVSDPAAASGYWILLQNGGVYSEGAPIEGSAYGLL